MYRKILGMALWLVSVTAMAQRENKGVFGSPVMPGPSGVFIYAYDTVRGVRKPAGNQFYTISKEEKKGAGFKKLATMGFPASAAELEKRLDKALLQEILQQRKLSSVQDLYAQLKAGRYDTLGLYSSSPPVLAALGILYIDKKTTRPDDNISYQLEVSDNGNTRVLYQVSLGEILYSPLPLFKKYTASISDSAALVTWYATMGRGIYASVFTNAGTGSENKFNPVSRQFVYSRRDTLFVTYYTPAVPGSRLLLFIRPEDIAGNRGWPSDTVHLLALSFENTLSIRHLTAVDTLGSVWLKWDSLPAKAWCSGIQVLKSRSATSDYIVVDTLPISAVSYRDRKVLSGNIYYYQLRPLLFDLPQRGRVSPALVNAHTKKLSVKIAAPQSLRITVTPAKDIRLSWQANSELEIFAYYILRGTSPQNMQVISPAIRDTVFIDSLKRLNTGITYLYAVGALNMDMQWSDTSAPVSMQSSRGRVVEAPAGILARATQQGVRLSWNDVSRNDASVTGYMLYKRKKGEQYFTPLTNAPVEGTYFTDSSSMSSGIYEYGCSSVDAWGHPSILSAPAEVDVAGAGWLYPPADFYLRNLSTGIEISVPPSLDTHEGQTRYILYRRIVTEKQFHKIAELTASNTVYTDRQVVKDQLYAYAIALQRENAESVKSGEKSIRRK